jgi:hypothetical protein
VCEDGFLKSGLDTPCAEARLEAVPEAPILKMFERADWTLFRTVEGLQQKAGVPAHHLRRLVLKEIDDNALDSGTDVRYGLADGQAGHYFIEDDGHGLDGTPQDIAELFSIARPLRSSKLLRLPQRGQLGNGLRVVAGAVLASSGLLTVITRGKRISLHPESNGTTTVVSVVDTNQPVGTRVEIGFGQALPNDPDPFAWVRLAHAVAGCGQPYSGRSSPFWYDAAQFQELLLACGDQPVRSLIAQLDGCTGGKAGDIVAAAGLDRARCQDVNREQATLLLTQARKAARPVSPERIGFIGRDAFDDYHYAKEQGTTALGGSQPRAEVPAVVEAWARKISPRAENRDEISIHILINRTPSVAEMSAWRDSAKDLCLQGNGFGHVCPDVPKKGAFALVVNLTTPYCPITSDGKAPNIRPFGNAILKAVAAAMRKAQRATPKDKKTSQKDVVLDHLDDAIAAASGDGQYRFNERQIFYQLRPIVLDETGQELLIGNFKRIITDYENENGEIEGMYREPRGSIHHPHRDEDIALGTLTVEDYERPSWTFNKLVYVEKEGFSEALKADGWPKRHDCALMSSKGFTTRAARDLVDKLAEHDEPVTIFCVHDADPYGTMIYQTFQEATKARGARKIRIANIGLEPWEALALDLEVETVPRGEKHKAVADYVLQRDEQHPNEAPGGTSWEEWLQTHRVELNAMTTPEFIGWLDRKMDAHGVGKLIPPHDVLAAEFAARLEAKVRAAVTERILREARAEDQIAAALAAIDRPDAADLKNGIEDLFADEPEAESRDHIEVKANELSRTEPDSDE